MFLFSIFKKIKQKIISNYQTCFLIIIIIVLKNKKTILENSCQIGHKKPFFIFYYKK